MYCPLCRSEYREGFTRCLDCDVELVQELPPVQAPEYEKMTAVFEGDSNSAIVARSRVESAGIETWLKDGGIQGLFPGLGSTEVLVRSDDEKRALEALRPPTQ